MPRVEEVGNGWILLLEITDQAKSLGSIFAFPADGS
jgi:hypothetical protein